ncbi:GNAT family N-acetyltransferase [Niallia sp. NCCP-28]|uniref:GNAT family N-acetyltransferase n=1 Tax=Niallia sp. NCCP-28 TaxID=2934712 RepID=UPI0020BEF487|nr:GNAT family N-acetyltransferase [Niallia sp. NCCP-28]
MYHSEFYLYKEQKPAVCIVRNYTKKDFDELIAIQSECFPPPFPSELWWNKEQLSHHVALFPEGAICVEIDGELAGSLTSLCINYDPLNSQHTWEEITDNGYIKKHTGHGNALYIVDISVRPKFRTLGLGKIMMESMYHLVIEKKLSRLLGGGRMPGYKLHADAETPQSYLQKVLAGKLKDPVISFLLKCGRTPVCILNNYLEDEDSLNYAVLMEWKNPFKQEIIR